MKNRIFNWSITRLSEDPFLAPEINPICVQGKYISERNGVKKERYIRTSPIVKNEGRKITTESGSVYYLGSIDPNYRRWLKKNRPNWDWRKPITVMED